MIFVTIGTHEQQFDRLIKKIDDLKGKNIIKEDVFIQLGYSNYIPENCEYKRMISFNEMELYSKDARIVITHGGPGSIMLPFKYNKVPVVVPRQSKYGEHVDDHQMLFAKFLEENNRILAIYEIDDIDNYIIDYEKVSAKIHSSMDSSNTERFTNELEKVIDNLLK